MVEFIDQHREAFGVEPICSVLPIAPSTYFRHGPSGSIPTRRSLRARRDDELRVEIRRVWNEHFQVYGPRKVWRQLRREGIDVARCRVRRLMRALGLAGAVRGRAWMTTTRPATDAARPPDLVDRQFTATRPNQLWVADFTYVATWRGFVYVAFVIDVFAPAHCGLARLGLAADGLRARCARTGYLRAMRRRRRRTLVHHSDRGTPAWVQGAVATRVAFR